MNLFRATRRCAAAATVAAACLAGLTSDALATVTYVDPLWKPAAALTELDRVTPSACTDNWSGGGDAAGKIFHGCGDRIHIRSASGVLLKVLNPNDGTIARRDVAPGAAGDVVYYTVGKRKDTGLTSAELAAGWGSVHRMTRTRKADGTYVWAKDPAFTFGPFKLYGGSEWSARYLTVTPDGTLYTTVNAFVYSVDVNGRVRSNEYGQYNAAGVRIGNPIAGYDADGSAPGFSVVEGIASSVDGAHLFVTEQDYDYVVRYSRDAAGAWRVDRLAGVPHSQSLTCADALFASPYDIGVTAAGSVMVADTTCGRVRRFNLELTELGNAMSITQCGLCFKPHGLAVGSKGDFLLPYQGSFYDKAV